MAILSTPVLSSDLATASQYDNLRTDAITHTHDGTDTPVITALGSGTLTGSPTLSGAPTVSGLLTLSAGLTVAGGNLTLSGTGRRITGDFSNATLANRLLLQTSTAGGSTNVGVIGNGVGAVQSLFLYNGSDPDNAGYARLRVNGSTDVSLLTNKSGSGTEPALINLGSSVLGTIVSLDTAAGAVTLNYKTTVAALTATPAGGSSAAVLLFGTTAGFGVYYGSGAPTVSAAQGSLYLRSDGSSTSTRVYVNTNGSTGWAAITTAS